MLVPVDLGFRVADDAFVGGVGLDLGRGVAFASEDEVGGFEEAGDALGEDLAEIDGAERVERGDLDRAGEDDGAFVEAVAGAENGEAGLGAAEDDGPTHGGGAAVQREQAGVELDGAMGGDGAEFLRHELGHVGHDADIGIGGAQGVQGLGAT